MDVRGAIKKANKGAKRKAKQESEPTLLERLMDVWSRWKKKASQRYLAKVENMRQQQIDERGLLLTATRAGGSQDLTKVLATPTQQQIEAHKHALLMKQKERITHQVFLDYLKQQRAQKDSCLTIPFTCCLFIVFICVIILHSNVYDCYITRHGLMQDLERVELESERGEILRLGSLHTREEVSRWLNEGFLPRTEGGVMKTYNRIVGSIVLSQTRAKRMDCDVSDGLQKFYGAKCFPKDQLYDGSDFQYLGPQMLVSGGLSRGKPATYYAWLNFWIEKQPNVVIRKGRADARQVLTQQQNLMTRLQNLNWLDGATVDLNVEFVTFNPETKVYLSVSILFTFHRGGWVESTVNVHSETSDLYANGMAIFADILWVTLIGILMLQEVLQMELPRVLHDVFCGCKKECRTLEYWMYLWEYFTDLWNFLDWASVILGFAIVFRAIGLQSALKDVSTEMQNFSKEKIVAAVGMGYNTAGKGLDDYKNSNLRLLDMLSDIEIARENFQFFGFVYSMIIILRFFKGFKGQPRIAIMALTLVKSGIDMCHFLLVFGLIYLNYAIGGYILFGTQLQEWNSLLKAMAVTLKILFGDFDYSTIYAIQPFIATVWFFSYIILTCFVVLNLLTALVYDHYMTIQHRTNFRGAQTITTQIKDIFRDFLMSQSIDIDIVTGKKRKIDYQILYKRVKEALVADEESAESKIEDEDKRKQMRLTRRQSTKDDTWGVSVAKKSYIGTFANKIVEPAWLVANCGIDDSQAKYLIKRCTDQFLADQKSLEPEAFLQYQLRFEFQDLNEMLQEQRAYLAGLKEKISDKTEELSRILSLNEALVKSLKPFCPDKWEFLWRDGRLSYHNIDTDEITDRRPIHPELYQNKNTMFMLGNLDYQPTADPWDNSEQTDAMSEQKQHRQPRGEEIHRSLPFGQALLKKNTHNEGFQGRASSDNLDQTAETSGGLVGDTNQGAVPLGVPADGAVPLGGAEPVALGGSEPVVLGGEPPAGSDAEPPPSSNDEEERENSPGD